MNLKKAWILGVVGYSTLRAVIAWGLFRGYGVNPWVFAVIDIGTAIPYAWSIADLPGSIVRAKAVPIIRNLIVAVVTFMAPYAYIWRVAADAPTNLRAGLIILLVCLLGAAVVGVIRKVLIGMRGEDVIDATDHATSVGRALPGRPHGGGSLSR